MLPTLWFGNASSTPTELTIREGEQVLGRAADADLCLSETFVSTYHARLTWQRGQLKVLDLNSTNGTLVNGVPVVGWTTLTDGDVIEFGGIEAVVTLPSVIDLDDPAPSFPPPPQHESKLTTGELPRVLTEPADGAHVLDGAGADGRPLPDDAPTSPTSPTSPTGRVAPVTLPPTPPTGITITDIEAVTGYDYGDYGDDLGGGVFGTDPGFLGYEAREREPFGVDHPESVRGRGQSRRRLLENGDQLPDQRPTPAFNRDGVSPIVIIIAVALLVVIILAAVFFS